MLPFFGENSVANAPVLQWKRSLNVFSWKQLDEASFLTFPPTEDRRIGSKSTVTQVFGFLFFPLPPVFTDSRTSAKVNV